MLTSFPVKDKYTSIKLAKGEKMENIVSGQVWINEMRPLIHGW